MEAMIFLLLWGEMDTNPVEAPHGLQHLKENTQVFSGTWKAKTLEKPFNVTEWVCVFTTQQSLLTCVTCVV
jgi:hypothetical protein